MPRWRPMPHLWRADCVGMTCSPETRFKVCAALRLQVALLGAAPEWSKGCIIPTWLSGNALRARTFSNCIEESNMTVYMVERSLKGIAMPDLANAQQSAISTAKQFTAEGTPVRYIRSTFVPETGACMCLFEADSAGTVERVNKEAKIPFDRVTEALDLTP